jgi:hypothetical protein
MNSQKSSGAVSAKSFCFLTSFRTRDFRDNPRNAMPAQEKVAHTKAGELSLIISKVASLHNDDDADKVVHPSGVEPETF